MFGLVPRVVWSRTVPPDERGRIEVEHNCLLLQSLPPAAPRTILIEVGTGSKLDAKSRDIFAMGERWIGAAGHPTALNGRKVEAYAYRKVGEPVIATPAGEFATAHYERVTESEKESRAQLWLAKDRFNLPVRVVFEDAKGLKLEQNLVSLTAR